MTTATKATINGKEFRIETHYRQVPYMAECTSFGYDLQITGYICFIDNHPVSVEEYKLQLDRAVIAYESRKSGSTPPDETSATDEEANFRHQMRNRVE